MMVVNVVLPKISVVVPVYKVEKYLKRCVDSILQQTYHNLEIILVDDGSPDRSGQMIDLYEKSDPRVKAVHKKNGGLSDARNCGMKYATGQYTLFVDSDDWLNQKMVEVLVTESIRHRADVVQAGFYYAYDDHLLFDKLEHCVPIVLNREALMTELVINERVKNFAWGKLYRTDLIRDIPFKKGVLFEDVFWAHLVMDRVHSYVITPQPLYYYYQRDDSIVASYSPRNLDIIRGLKERHQFLETHYKELTDESYKVILKTCLIHYHLLRVNKQKDNKSIHRKDIEFYIQKNRAAFKKAVRGDKELSHQLFWFGLHPNFHAFFIFATKALRKLKVISQPRQLERVDLAERGI